MLTRATTDEKPWLLGSIEEGWEWFAFTFFDQDQILLTSQEIASMLEASDQITSQAYSRMRLNDDHRWARHAARETPQIVEYCRLEHGQSVGAHSRFPGHALTPTGVMAIRCKQFHLPDL